MTTKVKSIEQYTDSQDTHIVCKGKLVLVEEFDYGNKPNKAGEICRFGYGLNIAGKADIGYPTIKPIIISETEEIKVGDNIYNGQDLDIWLQEDQDDITYQSTKGVKYKGCKKILALPNQFSLKHLQAIVDGKLKDNDDVYIECNEYADNVSDEDKDKWTTVMEIELTNNHIKLFPVKQEDWNYIIDRIYNEIPFTEFEIYGDRVVISQWLRANYHLPKRK